MEAPALDELKGLIARDGGTISQEMMAAYFEKDFLRMFFTLEPNILLRRKEIDGDNVEQKG